jgi:hypothetical protein
VVVILLLKWLNKEVPGMAVISFNTETKQLLKFSNSLLSTYQHNWGSPGFRVLPDTIGLSLSLTTRLKKSGKVIIQTLNYTCPGTNIHTT